MNNIKTLLLLVITSFSTNNFAMTGHAQKIALNFSMIMAAHVTANIAYAEGQNKPEHAPDYIDSEKYPTWAKFVQQYRCSPEIEKLVRENESKKTWIQHGIYKYNEIPFYNKCEDFDRIAYAELMKETIKEHNLDHLSVPDKCVCHIYGTAWNVIVKEAYKKNALIKTSLIEIQQIVKLIQKIGYSDIHKDNLFKINQNNIMIIDTEKRSFIGHKSHYLYALINISGITNNIEPEAKEWLEKEIEKEEAAKNSILTQLYKTLFSSFYYKKPDIDLDQVEKEYSDYKNSINKETKP